VICRSGVFFHHPEEKKRISVMITHRDHAAPHGGSVRGTKGANVSL